MKIILASNNQGKIAEIRSLLPQMDILTMREAGYTAEIEEPYDTFKENAWQKASTIWTWSKTAVLSDDSGICVHALNGAPGVRSARFAGHKVTDLDNNRKLLKALQGSADRSAYYYAVLCLIVAGEPYYFDGRCHGQIAEAPRGDKGFGYDPLFVPDGYDQTFAELSADVKSCISHRAAALSELKHFFSSDVGAALIQKIV